jgi:genome maintenance exonuclease 1
MEKHTPPTYVERYKYHTVKQINLQGKRLYEAPDGSKTPSVTTILGKTKDMTHLIAWKKRVGEKQAQQIVTEAAGVGTAMHNNLERFLIGEERKPGNNLVHVQANKMALVDVDEVWGIEQALYYPQMYSGTCDVVGQYKGTPCIMDFKQTNKPKKKEWVEDYYLQMAAYAMAHNSVYGTDIREGHVFMCSRALEYQQFDLVADEFEHWSNEWLKRVEDYYANHHF